MIALAAKAPIVFVISTKMTVAKAATHKSATTATATSATKTTTEITTANFYQVNDPSLFMPHPESQDGKQ